MSETIILIEDTTEAVTSDQTGEVVSDLLLVMALFIFVAVITHVVLFDTKDK